MGYKVVVTDHVFPDLAIETAELAKAGAQVFQLPECTEDTIIRHGRDADALMVGYAKITRRIIESLQRCKVIVRYGIGVDNVDLSAATEKGIPVANVPDYCVHEVADHTLALILACTRKIIPLNSMVKAGGWDYKPFRPMFRLRGRTLGLLGFGKIAQAVAARAGAFGFEVLAYDPYIDRRVALSMGVRLVSLAELLESADVLSVHAPLTPQTQGMLGRNEFARMKQGVCIVNTSRGGIIDEEALLDALASGRVGCAALDVLSSEPPVTQYKLIHLDNVVVTPHCAFYSEEAMTELRVKAAQEVERALAGMRVCHVVNPEVYDQQ